MSNAITDSEFLMWRAVFAFALADNVLSLEEQELLRSYLSQAGFSQKQVDLLKEDMHDPQNVVDIYRQITDDKDKRRFCVLARALAWCEGDMDRQEKEILRKASCFGEVEQADILYSTRGDAHVKTYYQEYAKSGIAGMMKLPHSIQMRI